MEGFEKFDLKKPEDIKYLIPSGFLKQVESIEDLWNLDEFDLMVRIVAAEAERQGREGKKGVSHVIMNRLKHPNPRRFGGDIKSIIRRLAQFDAITRAVSPKSEVDQKVRAKILNPLKNFPPGELWETVESVGEVYFGGAQDNTGGADHFHRKDEVPPWGPSMDVTTTIGKHTFRRSR